MAARWASLTEFLSARESDVSLSWSELDAIVGGLPDSAINHYPQWWHGDRPNTRAWRAAGYEATQIRPGASVRFVLTAHRPSYATESALPTPLPRPSQGSARVADEVTTATPELLGRLDPSACLVVIPCSKSKRAGGIAGTTATAPVELEVARRRVLDRTDCRTDESGLMSAWQRYTGGFYAAAAPSIQAIALNGRLVLLSGGYGLVDGMDLIGNYDRMMKSRDWPAGLLERSLANRAAQAGLDVVAFVAVTTDYATVVRRTKWRLPAGRSAHLVSMRGVRGTGAVTRSLGQSLLAFTQGSGQYPAGVSVERMHSG